MRYEAIIPHLYKLVKVTYILRRYENIIVIEQRVLRLRSMPILFSTITIPSTFVDLFLELHAFRLKNFLIKIS